MMKISKSANEHLNEVPEITFKPLKQIKDASINRAMLCKDLIPKTVFTLSNDLFLKEMLRLALKYYEECERKEKIGFYTLRPFEPTFSSEV